RSRARGWGGAGRGQAGPGARRPPARPTPPIRPEWRAEMERLSEVSRARYRGLVYDDPDFDRFFAQVAPIAELSELNIGSRPPSRQAAPGGAALGARPRGFAGGPGRPLLASPAAPGG